MSSIRAGFVGAGSMARHYLDQIETMEDVEVVAVADIDVDRARRAAERYAVPHAFATYQELLRLEEINAVHVCTPNTAHREPAVAAVEAGRHVFVEKPLAASAEQAKDIILAARKAERTLFCSLHTRYNAPVIAARDIIDRGVLGDVYYAETVASRRRGIPTRPTFLRKELAGMGALVDIGIYSLDTALHLMGHPLPVSASGFMTNVIGRTHGAPKSGSWGSWKPEEFEVEELAAAWIRFDGGAVLVFKTSWAMHMDSLGGTFFLGSKGGLKLEPEFKLFRDEWGYMVDVEPRGVAPTPWTTRLRRELEDFYAAIRGGSSPPIDPEEVLMASVIFDAIAESAGSGGREVEISWPIL